MYIEYPIDHTKKLLNLVSEFGKRAVYKVNILKSKAFFYTDYEISEHKLGKKSHLHSNNKKKIVRNILKHGGK